MKTTVSTLLISLTVALVAGCATPVPPSLMPANQKAETLPWQIYMPVYKIYSVEEARELSDYQQLLANGTPQNEMDQPGAFVGTYTDTKHSLLGRSLINKTVVYVPPEFREQVKIGTILMFNRRHSPRVVNAVVPIENKEAYACEPNEPFLGITSCIIDAVGSMK